VGVPSGFLHSSAPIKMTIVNYQSWTRRKNNAEVLAMPSGFARKRFLSAMQAAFGTHEGPM
jgi:hypothetical protein